jgi:hypothetical protein
MSTSTGTGEELANELDDMSTLLTRGVVDGFTEASEAFSHELRGTDRFPDLMGRSVAGMIRANARLLDEMANVVRQMSDGWSVRARAVADGNAGSDAVAELDYDRLADLVVQRLKAAEANAKAAAPAKSAAAKS